MVPVNRGRVLVCFGCSPCLAHAQKFQVDSVECWLLKPPEEDDTSVHSKKTAEGSVLSKAKEDQQLLEWAGVKKGYSAGIRDEPLEE